MSKALDILNGAPVREAEPTVENEYAIVAALYRTHSREDTSKLAKKMGLDFLGQLSARVDLMGMTYEATYPEIQDEFNKVAKVLRQEMSRSGDLANYAVWIHNISEDYTPDRVMWKYVQVPKVVQMVELSNKWLKDHKIT